MAKPDKASHGIAAASPPGPVVLAAWPLAPQSNAGGQTPERCEGQACQGPARHRTRVARQDQPRHGRMQHTAPAPAPGPQAVCQGLPPAPVAVASGRAEAREGRRGLPAAWDARWRDVRWQAHVRWGWPARAPTRGRAWRRGARTAPGRRLAEAATMRGAVGPHAM